MLSIGTHIGLLEYTLEQGLLVKTNLCNEPTFLDVKYLPKNVKELYAEKYQQFLLKFDGRVLDSRISSSDPNNYRAVIKHHAQTCLDMLETNTPIDSESQWKILVDHCRRWDQVYNLDARKLYPELNQLWDKYGY